MKVKVINRSGMELPSYATPLSAGMDLRAAMEQSITLAPLERVLVPTGLFVELPEGYEMQIRPRSGLAAKHGITVLNSPGTIDADYRGEIKLSLSISQIPRLRLSLANELHRRLLPNTLRSSGLRLSS